MAVTIQIKRGLEAGIPTGAAGEPLFTTDSGKFFIGTGVANVWSGRVASGGTGNTTFTAYSVICAGTTSTGAFQNVSGVGTSGQVLTSNGAGALPTWQAAAGGSPGGADTQVQFNDGGAFGG